MSVLIKGMKMPTSCLKGGCPLDGFVCELWEDEYWSRVESPQRMRHKNCPLIELPNHGNLVDVDLLKAECKEPNVWWETEHQMRDILAAAQVVIPAERSEE